MGVNLSIIIPIWQEQKRIISTLDKLKKYLSDINFQDYEVILSVEKSNDKSLLICQNFCKENIKFRTLDLKKHAGKGRAVRKAMIEAKGDFALFMDADASTELSSINDFYSKLLSNKNIDFLIGNRYLKQSKIQVKQGYTRRFISRIFNFAVRMLFFVKTSDTQCGFKMFNKKSTKMIFNNIKQNGFAFDVEIFCLAKKYNFSYEQMPVVWQNDKDSKLGKLEEIPKIIIALINIKKRFL